MLVLTPFLLWKISEAPRTDVKRHALVNFAEAEMNHTKMKIWLQYIIRKMLSMIASQQGAAAHPACKDLL